jgi:uncharacterized protein YdeI (YjbR/CyaY-like superfamily)
MPVQITKTFTPKSRSEWLMKNHNKKSEIWLVYYKKHTGKPTVQYTEAVEEALCFGWIDGIEKRIDDERYAQRYTPRRKSSNWSDPNIARYKKLASQGLMTEAGKKAFIQKK